MTGFSASALAMLNGDAGLGAASALGGGETETVHGGMSTAKNRVASSTATAAKAASSASLSHLDNLKRTSSGAAKTAGTRSCSLDSGASGGVIGGLGDVAKVDLDVEGALRMLPWHLEPYFAAQRMEKKTQAHLAMLKRQHMDNGLIDEKTGLEMKREPSEEAEREKNKSRAAGNKGDDSGGGMEIDGDKIDGRAGRRSEAVVLMKSQAKKKKSAGAKSEGEDGMED